MTEYGGFWRRVLAYLIDVILLSIVGGIIGSMFGLGYGLSMSYDTTDPTGMGGFNPLVNLLSFVVGVAYFAGLESSVWQATVGKKALGMIVTDTNGNRISFLRAFGRYLGKILSAMILFIGFIMVAFTQKKQGLHDLLASTLVVRGEPGQIGSASVFE